MYYYAYMNAHALLVYMIYDCTTKYIYKKGNMVRNNVSVPPLALSPPPPLYSKARFPK